jgi:hypothetical protein
LIGAGLVTGKVELTTIGGQQALVTRMKITQAGRLARQPAAKRRRA